MLRAQRLVINLKPLNASIAAILHDYCCCCHLHTDYSSVSQAQVNMQVLQQLTVMEGASGRARWAGEETSNFITHVVVFVFFNTVS